MVGPTSSSFPKDSAHPLDTGSGSSRSIWPYLPYDIDVINTFVHLTDHIYLPGGTRQPDWRHPKPRRRKLRIPVSFVDVVAQAQAMADGSPGVHMTW